MVFTAAEDILKDETNVKWDRSSSKSRKGDYLYFVHLKAECFKCVYLVGQIGRLVMQAEFRLDCQTSQIISNIKYAFCPKCAVDKIHLFCFGFCTRISRNNHIISHWEQIQVNSLLTHLWNPNIGHQAWKLGTHRRFKLNQLYFEFREVWKRYTTVTGGLAVFS